MGPMLPVEWNQFAPYNDLVRYKNCPEGTTPTGCDATATAMLMAYWEWPASIDGCYFDWDLLSQYTGGYNRLGFYNGLGTKDIHYAVGTDADAARSQVAHLMERLGFYVNMDYGCDGSYSSLDKDAAALRRFGYSAGGPEDYNETKVLNSLRNGRPVLSRGDSFKEGSDYSGGHAWVTDGFMRQTRNVYYQVPGSPSTPAPTRVYGGTTVVLVSTETCYYYHQNWGWDGSDNGYYIAGSFNTNVIPGYASNVTRSGQAYNYQYRNMIVPNIYR
jgi:hypothetical protein